MSGLHASVGIAQLKKIQKFIKIKEIIHKNYINLFEKNKYFILCKYPDYIQSNYWLNIIILKRSIKYIHFKEIIMKMNNLGILIRPLWYPNHLQEAYKICEKYNLKKVNKLIKKSILLPSGVDINYKDQKYVYESINKLMTKYYED